MPTTPGATAPDAVNVLSDAEAAVTLLKEPRLRILELAQEGPVTAVELAERLGEPRQRVGYHVRQLEASGLLREASRLRRGSVLERRYVASARQYGLSPDLLGPLAAGVDGGDAASAAHLLGALHQVQREVAAALEWGASQGTRVPTLTVSTQLRFRDREQRGAFATALKEALTRVVAEHSLPPTESGGDERTAVGEGSEPFRLTLTLNPSET
ncbi:MAG: winged helix-turn-helix transcriptional regulator [Gemmatimonadetes bacterium]|nr:winged helix-turn-helix transcriptional regulator [Gemmatimonadota bacterium]